MTEGRKANLWWQTGFIHDLPNSRPETSKIAGLGNPREPDIHGLDTLATSSQAIWLVAQDNKGASAHRRIQPRC
jgi:hypothetical protein